MDIANVPCLITNAVIHEALNMNPVKKKISLQAEKYKTRLEEHLNKLANQLT